MLVYLGRLAVRRARLPHPRRREEAANSEVRGALPRVRRELPPPPSPPRPAASKEEEVSEEDEEEDEEVPARFEGVEPKRKPPGPDSPDRDRGRDRSRRRHSDAGTRRASGRPREEEKKSERRTDHKKRRHSTSEIRESSRESSSSRASKSHSFLAGVGALRGGRDALDRL